ncbi:MAG TPA: methionyl-tRNA formyltransferase [Candidatus Peribacteraceae bacterium]|nr:methionyl-tRNA formyltransferase [Candidatus Peribacteraceae bacterium]
MSHSILFCGTPHFAVPSLRMLLHDDDFEVKAVITQPDKPVGRKQTLTYPPVKTLALDHQIPVLQPENINTFLPDYIEKHPEMKPDFLVVVAYGKILKQAVLDLPNIAPINVHASVLPRWRGASPIEHAILNGDATTGVTIQIMSAGLDEGPILSIDKIGIGAHETAPQLRERLSVIGAELLVKTLKEPLHPVPQSAEGITVCTKIKKEDGNVDPKTMSAWQIERAIRAYQPWPGVKATIDGHEVKLIEASIEPDPSAIAIACNENTTLYVTMLQPPGKKPMKATDWQRGLRN